jgi:hypothetical protein
MHSSTRETLNLGHNTSHGFVITKPEYPGVLRQEDSSSKEPQQSECFVQRLLATKPLTDQA